MDKEIGRLLKKEHKSLLKEAKRIEGLLARVGIEVKRRKKRKGRGPGKKKKEAAFSTPKAPSKKTSKGKGKGKGGGKQLNMFPPDTVASTKAERAAALRAQKQDDGEDVD
jgi:hypothetical protein